MQKLSDYSSVSTPNFDERWALLDHSKEQYQKQAADIRFQEHQVAAHEMTEQHDEILLAIELWLLDKYALTQSKCTEKTYRDTVLSLRTYLQAQGLDLYSPAVDTAIHIQTWSNERTEKNRRQGNVAPSTYNQRVAATSSFYRWAIKSGMYAGAIPTSRLNRAKVEKYAKSQALSPQLVSEKLKNIDRTTPRGLRDYVLLQVAVNTGRSSQELASLTWKCIHIDQGIVTLTFERCKGGKTIDDTLDPRLSKALLMYIQTIHSKRLNLLTPQTPIWISFSDRSYGQAIGPQTIADICEHHLGISTVSTLRHTFALTMEQQGAHTSTIQQRLGYESFAATDTYLTRLKNAQNPHAPALADVFSI